jgi:transcription initiation factor TFIIIB Brf1 subunit/transcription initiation factor TFIIB
MSELAGLAPKPKEFDINGTKLSFVPIEFDEDCAALLEMVNLSATEKIDQIKKIIKKMLKKSYPDATEEELEYVNSMRNILPLFDAFSSVMGLDNAKVRNKINILKDVQRQKIEQARQEAGQPAA